MHLFIVAVGALILWLIEQLNLKTSQKIIILSLMLLVFGIFALYSISIFESFDQTLSMIGEGVWEGDPSNYFYFNKQVSNIITALVMVGITYFIPIKLFKHPHMILVIGVGAILLQLLVFSPLGIELNGARGWIVLPGLGSLQPAEFFKIGFVIFFAGWLIRKKKLIPTPSFYGFFVTLIGAIGFVFLLIPDLGSLFVIVLIAFIMAWYAGAKLSWLVGLCLGGGIAGLTLISLFPQFNYISERLSYFVSTDATQEEKQDIGWQTDQALIAIGGGGFWGQGYGKGLQKFGQIPEAQSDFIFAALSEEIGFVGNVFMLFVYFLLVWYTLKYLPQMKDPYSRLLAVGIVSLIGIQVFVNIGVNTKLLPNTGLTLPFISYGGTALMVNLIEIVLLYKLIENK